MARVELQQMPDHSRLWVHAFDHPLSAAERAVVTDLLQEHVESWESHGNPVHGYWTLLDGRILLIAGWCPDGVSGCSTDSMIRVLKRLQQEHGLNALGGLKVAWRDDDGNVQVADRSHFAQKVAAGEISADTPVFDMTVTSIGAWRNEGIEKQFSESWHAEAFQQKA